MSATHPLRVGIIGGGNIATNHTRGFRMHPEARVDMVAEINPERREWFAREFDIPETVADYRDILARPEIDVVSIALPNFLHAPVTIEALEAGKHVLLEKPMATCAEDASKIVETSRRTGRKVMVGQNVRFTPSVQALRQLVHSGGLGHVFHSRTRRIRRSGIPVLGSWFTRKKEAGGGCLYDLGVHILDAALHILNRFDVSRVSGSISSNFGSRGIGEGDLGKSQSPVTTPFDVEDFASALLRFNDGSTLVLETSWANHLHVKTEVTQEFFGTEGSITGIPPVFVRNSMEEPMSMEQLMQQFPPDMPENRCVHFVNWLLDRCECAVPLEQSLHVQEVLDAIYRSAESGREEAVGEGLASQSLVTPN